MCKRNRCQSNLHSNDQSNFIHIATRSRCLPYREPSTRHGDSYSNNAHSTAPRAYNTLRATRYARTWHVLLARQARLAVLWGLRRESLMQVAVFLCAYLSPLCITARREQDLCYVGTSTSVRRGHSGHDPRYGLERWALIIINMRSKVSMIIARYAHLGAS